jgi:uncharacterized repeat protein (TIGR03803 family)
VRKSNVWTMACVVLVFCLVAAIASPAATTFTTLGSFAGTNGSSPNPGLVQGTDGNFYGTTANGGANCAAPGCGTVFKITPAGTLTTLYSFCAQTGCPDGSSPKGGLVQGIDGNFYGTTTAGGTLGCNAGHGCGTVFKITVGGTLTTLRSFAGQSTDGGVPEGALVQGPDGNLYGTTQSGGTFNFGAAFKISPSGAFTLLHSFNNSEGASPNGGLITVTSGYYYYGATKAGGIDSTACPNRVCGTLFKVYPSGTFAFLHSFDGTEGASPFAGLVLGNDGNFYGTTNSGGANNDGTVFKFAVVGHVLTTLHSFAGSPTDGGAPQSGLALATDGSFYGTTSNGGANCGAPGCGTVFKITPTGTLTTLHSFCAQTGCPDGELPTGGLVQGTDGNFYGTTVDGGANNACGTIGCGTIFRLGVGLGPFVATRSTSRKVGATVIILGTNLTGATSVSFNGAAATFTVVSSSEITTTVPAGATTGKVQVTTPSSTLKSSQIFHVTPQILSFTPTSGPVGTPVQITGVSLTQTTGVTFGGVKATSFTVNSDTQVTATVPTGAVTGRIVLSTAGGASTSAVNFTVTP